MSGDCPECGMALIWGGMGWTPHTDDYHRAARRWMLRTVARQLVRLTEHKMWLDELAADDMIGFRWRNGVFPGWQLEERWELPREFWERLDDGEKYWALRVMRIYLSEDAKKKKHGVDVNPATWFHRMYDEHPKNGPS